MHILTTPGPLPSFPATRPVEKEWFSCCCGTSLPHHALLPNLYAPSVPLSLFTETRTPPHPGPARALRHRRAPAPAPASASWRAVRVAPIHWHSLRLFATAWAEQRAVTYEWRRRLPHNAGERPRPPLRVGTRVHVPGQLKRAPSHPSRSARARPADTKLFTVLPRQSTCGVAAAHHRTHQAPEPPPSSQNTPHSMPDRAPPAPRTPPPQHLRCRLERVAQVVFDLA